MKYINTKIVELDNIYQALYSLRAVRNADSDSVKKLYGINTIITQTRPNSWFEDLVSKGHINNNRSSAPIDLGPAIVLLTLSENIDTAA